MKLHYLLLLFIFIGIYSCQKELKVEITQPGGGSDTTVTNPGTDPVDSLNSIKGEWNFISLEAKTKSTAETSIQSAIHKTVTFLDYVSVENSGTMLINDSVMYCAGIAYKVLSKIKTYHYKNEVLIDSLETPYINTFPATDSYTLYKFSTDDSVFFKKGGFTNISAARFKLTPSAAKVILDDNNLTFVQSLYKDSVENISGTNYHVIQEGEALLKFKRK